MQSCADCVYACCKLYVDLNGTAGCMGYRKQRAVPV